MENKPKKQVKKPVKKTSFLKKYWHIIVIVVLLMFGMMQCTKSCNRSGSIKLQNIEMQKRDSIIENLEVQVDTLTNSLHYYIALYESETKHNSNFTSIATGNQNDLYNQMNQLNAQILSLQNEKILLDNTIRRLNSENSMLKDSILYYKDMIKQE